MSNLLARLRSTIFTLWAACNRSDGGKEAKILGKPDWKTLKDHLSKEGRLDKTTFKKLIADVMKVFSNYLQLKIRVRGKSPAYLGSDYCSR